MVGAAIVAALVAWAFGAITDQRGRTDPSPTLQDLAADPRAYLGERVTVVGRVREVLRLPRGGDRREGVFTLDGRGVDVPLTVVSLARTAFTIVDEGAVVEVTGRMRTASTASRSSVGKPNGDLAGRTVLAAIAVRVRNDARP